MSEPASHRATNAPAYHGPADLCPANEGYRFGVPRLSEPGSRPRPSRNSDSHGAKVLKGLAPRPRDRSATLESWYPSRDGESKGRAEQRARRWRAGPPARGLWTWTPTGHAPCDRCTSWFSSFRSSRRTSSARLCSCAMSRAKRSPSRPTTCSWIFSTSSGWSGRSCRGSRSSPC